MTSPLLLRPAVATGLALVIGLTSAACGGSDPAPSTATTTTTPTATPTPEPRSSLLSGRDAKDGPVLVVKLDNSRAAIPHIGLTSADVVYVQQVEGGISRLAAVYSTRYPKRVAPVRSARETDAQLLPQYGEVPLGFSGSVASVHALIRKAGLVDVSEDRGGAGYFRLSGRYAPHNLAARPSVLLERAGPRPAPQSVGFTFAPTAPAGGTAATQVTATMPAARVRFDYRPSTKAYAVSLDGKPDRTKAEGQVAATTVIIQSVRVRNLARVDTSGARVPVSTTVGTGKAVVLRDGKSWNVTWSRPSVDQPTRWIYQGQDFPMNPGQIWVVLLDKERSPRIK
jgi:hypothetical protein